MTISLPRFDAAAAYAAQEAWGANCGPGALAAILRLTLDEVRPLVEAVGFVEKRYTNATMMMGALKRQDRAWHRIEPQWPVYGLARIQWEGPWTAPGVPMVARLRHTHWVGVGMHGDVRGIFDINAIGNGSGWLDEDSWANDLVPWLLAEVESKADGKWHITHAIEVVP